MSFFPSDDGAPPPQALPEVDDRPLERDDSVGQFPGEFGVPVSIPEARIVFDEPALAFDQYLVFDVGFYVTLRVLQRSPRMDSHDRDLAESFFGGIRTGCRTRSGSAGAFSSRMADEAMGCRSCRATLTSPSWDKAVGETT